MNDKAVDGLGIRTATSADAEILHGMVCELAEYERLGDINCSSPESIAAELSSPEGILEACIAEQNGEPVGMATFFHTYSTFAARRGLLLEDLYVKPNFRHLGIGTHLLRFVGKIAVQRNCGRMEWSTLLWNTAAIEFYESLGATPNDAWTTDRIFGDNLHRLAGVDSTSSAEATN